MISALIDLLSTFYQAGDLEQMEAIARSMLAAMPDDIVALQFLGLAFYLTGRIDDAYRTFKRAATDPDAPPTAVLATVCEPAAAVSYREATRPDSGLADGWHRIAHILARFGFHKPAARALRAAQAARGGGPPCDAEFRGGM